MTKINTNLPSSTAAKTNAVMSKIEVQLGKVQDMLAEVRALLSELRAQADSKPSAPNISGMKKDAAAAAMAQYQKKMSKWQSQLSNINSRLVKAQRRLNDGERDLQKLQTQELPRAQAQDAAGARKKIEDARKQIKAQAEAFDTGKADSSEGTNREATRMEIKAKTLKDNVISIEVSHLAAKPGSDAKAATGTNVPLPKGSGIPTDI